MSEQREPQELTEQDLEKYGVWVKTGPEDVVDEVDSGDATDLQDYPRDTGESALSGEADLDFDLDDISLDDEGSVPSVDDLDTLDIDLDEEGETEPAASESSEDVEIEDGGDEDLPDFSMDDLDFDIDDGEEVNVEAPREDDAAQQNEEDELDQFPESEDIDLEAELDSEVSLAEADLASLNTEDVDLDDDFELTDEDDEDAESYAALEAEIEESEEEGEVVTLDDLGIEESEEEPDPFADLPEEEHSGEEAEDAAEAEEIGEVDLSELQEEPEEQEDDAIPSLEGDFDDLKVDEDQPEDGEGEFGGEELPELEENEHDFTPEDAGIEIEEPEVPMNRLAADEEEFFETEVDEAPADEEEFLETEVEEAPADEEEFLETEVDEAPAPDDLPKETSDDIHTAGSQPMDAQDREALTEITRELHEIRSELADLKRVLSGARQTTPPSPPEQEESQDAAAPVSGGFFDEEDEDETIALTGDELDNILNTAEFTEETGQAAQLDDESDFFIEESEPEVDEFSAEDPAVEEITLEEIEGGVAEAPEETEATGQEEEDLEFGDESQVDRLAQLDIESELADIDELKDEDEDTEGEDELGEVDFDEIELGEEIEEEPEDQEAEAPEPEGPPTVTDEEVLDEELEEPELEEPELEEPEIEEPELEEHEIEEPEIEEPEIEGGELTDSPEDFAAHFDQMEREEAEGGAPAEVEEAQTTRESSLSELPDSLKAEIRSVLTYMDQLLEALPEEKIQEFAESEHFEVYRRLFDELGIDS